MKKAILGLALIIAAIIPFLGMNRNGHINAFNKVRNAFYESSYSYKKTTVGNDEEIISIIEGEITSPDYKEHISVIEDQGTSQWSEAYYWGQGALVTGRLKTPEGWINVSVKRSYPNGYGEHSTVEQEYYIDLSSQAIKKIVTDLSDVIYQTSLATIMSSNNCTLEEAKEKVDPEKCCQTETLEVLSYEVQEINIDLD